jgi:UDP-N-acetylglucosamine 1-carboxyvinyltransferase
MSKFLITGGRKLAGQITVSGAKNATFPLIAACLLADEDCVLTNVPEIKDKDVMVEIIRDLGVTVEVSPHKLTINAKGLHKHRTNADLVGKLRGSILVLSPLLSRLGRVETVFPGGDQIGKRSIEPHLSALRALGVTVEKSDGELHLSVKKLIGAKIVMEESSVVATENAILAAVLASGQTMIKLAAMEPHVQQLCEFLNLMGAKISGIGTSTVVVQGVAKLHGAEIKLIPDAEEAASMITMAAATKSEIKISPVNPDTMDYYLLKLRMMGVEFETGLDFIQTRVPKNPYQATKIQSGLYPKLNSDFLPPMSVLATQAEGETIIHEWMYENRQGYVSELKKMGANAEIVDMGRVRIIGPTKLHGEKITTFDLRMGMTLVIAALVAEGQSEISDIHHIDRGYAKLEERLSALGADIKRIE